MPTDRLPATIAGVPTRAPSVGSGRNYHLDAMRGLSALIVVAAHICGTFFVPYREAGNGLLIKIIYLDHFAAGAAVLFFFALSGYLVGTSVLKAQERNRWSWANYLLSRLARLYTVLLPGLIAALVLDLIGRYNSLSSWVYLNNVYENGLSIAKLDTISAFLGTIAFVEGIYTTIFGSYGATWSLPYEFWYYILFPLAVVFFLSRGTKRWLNLVLFLAVAAFSGTHILTLFPIWLAGVLAGLLVKHWPVRSTPLRRTLYLLSAALMLGMIVIQGAHHLQGIAGQYIMGLAALGLVYTALCSPPATGLYAKIAVFFSEISYTLYLTHFPLVYLTWALWLRGGHWRPDPKHIALAFLPFLACLLYAYVMYFLFESRTDVFRLYVKTKVLDRLGITT